MTDGPIDVGPFLERHDRRTKWIYIALLSASLALSAAIFLQSGSAPGVAAVARSTRGMAMLWGPATIAALWIATTLYARAHPRPADGHMPMNPDDARNVERVANAGTVFVAGFGMVVIGGQLLSLLWLHGFLARIDPTFGLRATLVAVGALSIYFGNVSPRMPTPRAPAEKPGVRMKYNRLAGWLCVLLGLAYALSGLALPLAALPPVIGLVSAAVVTAFAVGTAMYYREIKAPGAR